MKRRVLPIAMTALMILAFVPLGISTLAADEYTAKIEGQLDGDVSQVVDEWGLGDEPGAVVTGVKIGKEAKIKMSFTEPIKFTGNWTGITLNIPIENDAHAGTTGAKILSFITDGTDHGERVVPIIDRDGAGFLCIDIARQWGGDYDPYDLAGMEPFSELEITFIIPNEPEGFKAYLAGQLDTEVSEAVEEWGIESEASATTDFELGKEATIKMTFPEPIKFTGNWTGITTNVWVLGNTAAESTGAKILSFKVDGEDLGEREVPLISRDGEGWLCLDIARQWGGDYDPYGLQDMEPFTELEITFIVPEAPTQVEDPPEGSEGGDLFTTGNAWIGGTFIMEDGSYDWIEYSDQTVPIELGVPFTAVLDLGSDTQTHVEPDWGYITVVQTDVDDKAILNYDAFISEILVDGRSVPFDPTGVEVGYDRGLRVALTSIWSDNPPVSGINEIGTFSKMEVTMVFVQYGEPNPFGDEGGSGDNFEPPPSVAPIERQTPAPSIDEDSGGLPGWAIPVIIAGALVVVVVVVIMIVKSKK